MQYTKRPVYKTKHLANYNRNKRWCENHPQSVWGDDYKQCAEGFRTNTPCKDGTLTT